ncbi:hypothetical protein BKA61DRAFT_708661 [Leptodontidium sp. MPI-SDFR-AT-0119]|nr:hypothetical protein BKA61DRAFT_708661 [Leptodontidium sp. MPI-SDFR-AT-0119]
MSNVHFRLWTQVHGYQNNTYGCGNIEAGFSVTETQLLSWNTWIGSDCDTGLYANLAYGGIRAICIGLGGSSPTSTTSSSSTSTTFTMGPIPTDTISGWQDQCTNLWLGEAYCVQGPSATSTTTPTTTNPGPTGPSGDSCAKVESEYDITFAQLYQWNPAIGSDCQFLVIGDSYCVGVSS